MTDQVRDYARRARVLLAAADQLAADGAQTEVLDVVRGAAADYLDRATEQQQGQRDQGAPALSIDTDGVIAGFLSHDEMRRLVDQARGLVAHVRARSPQAVIGSGSWLMLGSAVALLDQVKRAAGVWACLDSNAAAGEQHDQDIPAAEL